MLIKFCFSATSLIGPPDWSGLIGRIAVFVVGLPLGLDRCGTGRWQLAGKRFSVQILAQDPHKPGMFLVRGPHPKES
jgi:hypothetical protein